MRRILFVLAAIASTACAGIMSPREAEQLRDAEQRWERAGIRDYTFEMRTSCFCPTEILAWAVVHVRDGQVAAAYSLDGTPLSGFDLDSRKTVEELFAVARAKHEHIADIDFEFDEELGYPLRIRLEEKRNVADASATYEARNLVPAVAENGSQD